MSHKHLIFSFDGTWTSPSEKSANQRFSNVFLLNNILKFHDEAGSDQICFYYPGIGSRAFGSGIRGAAFGMGFERAIESAYIDLCSNYTDGDRVYFLAYSRGAAVARAVAGMVSSVGILRPEKLDNFHLAWKHYLGLPLDDADQSLLARSRQAGLDPDSRIIAFVGLFDPVFSGFGAFVSRDFVRFFNRQQVLPREIRRAVAILAIDETRLHFAPMLWSALTDDGQALTQIWMPGVHGDVGGVVRDSLFGHIALMTMIEELQRHTDLSFYDTSLNAISALIDNMLRLGSPVTVSVDKRAYWRYLGSHRRAVAPSDFCRVSRYVDSLLGRDVPIYYKLKHGRFDDFYGHLRKLPKHKWQGRE